MNQAGSFEETYPRYPFAGLVRVSLVLAGLWTQRRADRAGAASKALP